LPLIHDPNLLVGFNTNDDAAVYRLNDNTALVVTADFITPPVADPYIYGQIAAANAISDIYAMGGTPLVCLNLVAFPAKKLPPQVLHQIIAGAVDKITESGAVLAGGHSIDDDEPKFGLSVTGIVHPQKYWRNSGAQPGDVLILTKPIGSGVIFNANIKKWVSAAALAECLAHVTALNKTAAAVMQDFDIHAATDITGFGLAGHSLEMAKGSQVTLEIVLNDVPILAEALEMYRKGVTTGMNQPNHRLVEKNMVFTQPLPPWQEQIVYDPQTSGGLLVAVAPAQGPSLVEALQKAGVSRACLIGKAKPQEDSTYLMFK
jgi:selenide,water dikinase